MTLTKYLRGPSPDPLPARAPTSSTVEAAEELRALWRQLSEHVAQGAPFGRTKGDADGAC